MSRRRIGGRVTKDQIQQGRDTLDALVDRTARRVGGRATKDQIRQGRGILDALRKRGARDARRRRGER